MSPEPQAELVSHRLMGSEEGIPRQDRTRGGVGLLLGTLSWSTVKTATRGAEKGEGICESIVSQLQPQCVLESGSHC